MPSPPPETHVVPEYIGVAPEARRIVGLAWPVTAGQLALVGLGTVDVIIVGQLGATALAAFSLANVWSFSLLAPGLGAAIGLDPFFTRAYGAGAPTAAGMAFVRGLAVLGIVAVPMIGLHLAAAPILGVTGQDADVLPLTAACCAALALRVPAFLGFVLVKQLLQANGWMRPAMIVAVAANVVNLAADIWLVWGGLGVPALGPVGAAWATTIVQWFMLAALVGIGAGPLGTALRGAWHGPTLSELWRTARMALPVGAHFAVEIWAFNVASVLAGAFGATALAAHTVVLNLTSLAFMVPIGIGAAGTTRVGNLVGAGRPWRPSGWVTVGVGGVAVLFAAGIFVSIPETLARVYTSDASVIALAVAILPIGAAFQVFDATQATSAGVLRGIGDTRTPFIANLFAHWCVGLPVGAGLAFGLGWGLHGLWTGLIVGLALTAGLLVLRIARADVVEL